MPEPMLTSFAISFAAGTVLKVVGFAIPDTVGKQIDRSFNSALNKFAANETDRNRYRLQFKNDLRLLLKSPQMHDQLLEERPDLKSFLKFFDKEIVKKTEAFRFLQSKTDDEFRKIIIEKLNEIEEALEVIPSIVEFQDSVKSIEKYNSSNSSIHKKVYPASSINVDELFIDRNSKFYLCDKATIISEDDDANIDVLVNYIKAEKVLIIQGKYGTGKTVLSKKIESEINEYGIDSVFIKSEHLSPFLSTENTKLLLSDVKNSVIILDALDELNIHSGSQISNAQKVLHNILLYIEDNSLIITTRALELGVNIVDSFMDLLLDAGVMKFGLYLLDVYKGYEVDAWLENYFFIKTEVDAQIIPIKRSDLKSWSKGLSVACLNPIMLYHCAERYINQNANEITEIYSLYEEFVENTIKGKFKEEKRKGSSVLGNIADSYKEILTDISILILSKRTEIDEKEHFHLDSNATKLTIDYDNLTKEIHEKIAKFISNFKISNDTAIDLKFNILNCYFFTNEFNNWRFRDNNIVHYLIASRYYEIIKYDIFDNIDYSIDGFYNQLSKLSSIPLSRVSIEFLLNKIDQNNKKYKLLEPIKTLINRAYFLNISEPKNLKSLSLEKVRIDILLSILYLQINNEKFTDIEYYFKRLMWYTNSVKIISPNLVSIVKRFFKNIKIRNGELRRINLKGFNFDESTLIDVSFLQDKLNDTRMNLVEFKNTKFELCDISNMSLESSGGDIQFKNSIINQVIFENPLSLEITFSRCQIQKLTIRKSRKNSKRLKIKFINCDIRQLDLKKLNIDVFSMEECIFDSPKFMNCQIHSYNCINSYSRSGRPYTKDNNCTIVTSNMNILTNSK